MIMLQVWVERVSLQDFGLPFRHQATFNSRLTSTGGRYFTKTHHIEISPHQLENYGTEETEKIIKHELCHYHLHLLKRGYQHRDEDFKAAACARSEERVSANRCRKAAKAQASLINISWFAGAAGRNICANVKWIRKPLCLRKMPRKIENLFDT